MKKVLLLTGVLLIILIVIFLLGPREIVDDSIKPIILPDDIDQYLASRESQVQDLVQGTEKKIIWAHLDKQTTEYALLYLHGFSASRQEVSPLCEEIADEISANLFLTRLKAHGRDSEAFLEAKPQDWFQDAYEAWEISRKIGKKIIIIGTSFSANLTSWLCTNYGNIAAIIIISPYFESINRAASTLLTLPWDKQISRLLLGKYHSFEPHSELEEKYWTTRYRIEALPKLFATVKFCKKLDYTRINIPVFFIYTEKDDVINVNCVKQIYDKWGSRTKNITKKILNYKESDEHVLVGSIISPQHVEPIRLEILNFLNETVFMDNKQ